MSDTFERHVTWQDATAKDERRLPLHTTWLLAALASLVLGVAGFVAGHRPVAGLAAKNTALALEVQRLSHNVRDLVTKRQRCLPFSTDLQTIRRFVAKGQFGEAAALANLDLTETSAPICPQTQPALAGLWYTSRIDELLAMPPSSPLDTTPILAWWSIERRADALGLSPEQRLSPLTVVTLSYNNHLWSLARAAFIVAWRHALIGPTDYNQLNLYYACLRNLGRALATTSTGLAHTEGLVLLRTADQISHLYGLGRGEARSDLTRLLGRSELAWPAPDTTDIIFRAGAHRR